MSTSAPCQVLKLQHSEKSRSRLPSRLKDTHTMSTSQIDGVRDGASESAAFSHTPHPILLLTAFMHTGSPQKASAAGTDGGWIHSTPLKTRYSSPTGLMSFDGDSAWFQYDPHVVVPKEWGKQSENWIGGLRDIGDISPTGPSWKHTNFAVAAQPGAKVRPHGHRGQPLRGTRVLLSERGEFERESERERELTLLLLSLWSFSCCGVCAFVFCAACRVLKE